MRKIILEKNKRYGYHLLKTFKNKATGMDATSKPSVSSMDANGKTSTAQNLITLTILAANIQGASNITDSRYKFGILATYEEESKKSPIDITFLSETWYDQDIHVHENDLNLVNEGNGQGSGMVCSYRPDLKAKVKNQGERIQIFSLENSINFIHVYAPQVGLDNGAKKTFKSDLKDAISSLDNDLPILIFGDLNIPRPNFEKSYLGAYAQHGRLIYTNKPTQRFGSELDYGLLLKEDPENKIEIKATVCDLATSDHQAIKYQLALTEVPLEISENSESKNVTTSAPIPRRKSDVEKFKIIVRKTWNKFVEDYPKLKSMLNQDLNKKTSTLKTKKRGNQFKLLELAYNTLRQILTSTAILLTKRKNKHKKPKRTTPNQFSVLYTKYKNKEIGKRKFQKQLKRLQKSTNREIYRETLNVEKQPKTFFKKIKDKMGENQRKRTPKFPYQGIYKNYKEIYMPEDINEKNILDLKKSFIKHEPDESLSFLQFEVDQVKEAIRGINKGKSSRGPKIELWELSGLWVEITNLLNAFVRYSYLPTEFMTADIKFLKKDDSLPDSISTNYRPISLVESLSKVFESLMKTKINFDFSWNQYAYQENKGCSNALKSHMQFTNKLIQTKGICYTVFLDLSKAFDKLSYSAIFKNFENEFESYAYKKIFSELITKTSATFDDGKYQVKPRRGIRQGSILSPWLFLQCCDPWLRKYANVDSVKNLIGRIKAYADDITIQASNIVWLQNALNSFSKFCIDASLQANAGKCKIIVNMNLKNFEFYSQPGQNLPKLSLNGVILEYVQKYKYLGYYISNQANDVIHLSEIFSNLRKRTINFRRYFKGAPDKLLVIIATTYLQSTLYCIEFSERIPDVYLERYKYIMSILFGKKTSEIQEKLDKYKELDLMEYHQKGRLRVKEIDTFIPLT